MSLLSENKRAVPKLSRKTKWIIFLALLVGLVGSNVIYMTMGGGRSSRVKEYLELNKLPASREDSARIHLLYAKLAAMRDTLIEADYCQQQGFEFVDAKKLPASFESKLITFSFLQYLFDSTAIADRKRSILYELDETMGSGNFPGEISFRKFNAGFAHDAKYILDEKYILVLVTCELTRPSFIENTKTFESGYYTAQIIVFNLETMKAEGSYYFEAGTDDEIKSIPYVKGKMDEKLLANMVANISRRVDDASVKIFGKKLKNNYR